MKFTADGQLDTVGNSKSQVYLQAAQEGAKAGLDNLNAAKREKHMAWRERVRGLDPDAEFFDDDLLAFLHSPCKQRISVVKLNQMHWVERHHHPCKKKMAGGDKDRSDKGARAKESFHGSFRLGACVVRWPRTSTRGQANRELCSPAVPWSSCIEPSKYP